MKTNHPLHSTQSGWATALLVAVATLATALNDQAALTCDTGVPTFNQLKSFGKPWSASEPAAELIQGNDGALYGTTVTGGSTVSGGSSGYGTAFKISPDGSGFTVLKNLDYSTTGGNPSAGLIQGIDGALYGTAYWGGSAGYGTVFKVNPDGTGFTVLKNFDRITTGGDLYAGLAEGSDGALYGTAYSGGNWGYGTLFKINPDGTGFAILKNLDYSTTGANPVGALAHGTDGALYGTTVAGGSSGYGTVFKVNPDGTGFTVLKNFDSLTTGGSPHRRLVQGIDGALYGTTFGGGSAGYGTVFKINPNGTGFAVLKTFDSSTTGREPLGGLLRGSDGALYGTASSGGSGLYGYGTVFKLNPDGTGFTVLQNFDCLTTGARPRAGLLQGTDGALYGMASTGGALLFGGDAGGNCSGGGTVFKLNPDGSGFTVLKRLYGALDFSEDGGYPYAEPIQGTDGALYGTAYGGGSGGYGTVFKLNPDGSGFTVLKNFDLYTTGGRLIAGLIQGTDGALYGTAAQGGTSQDPTWPARPMGGGTVFKLNPDGTGFAVLKNFDYRTTGGGLHSELMQGIDGALYGIAASGGSGLRGTIFKLNPDGTGFTVLKNFDAGGWPIWGPRAGLIQGADGVLYGTTLGGGSIGAGTVFKLNPDGSGFTILKNFDYSATGSYLYAKLLHGTDGALYGMAYQGGRSDGGGLGTIFKLHTDGTGFNFLKYFTDTATGGFPQAALMQATDGALYGRTSRGGSSGWGTVFRLTPDGTAFSVLKNFDRSTILNEAYAGLMQGTDGNLYSTTTGDGYTSGGTVFRLVLNDANIPEDSIVWHQPVARNGASDDTDPSAGGTLKYGFKMGSTIPVQIHVLGCAGADVTSDPNVVGRVEVFEESNCDGMADGNVATIDYTGVGEAGGVMDKIGEHLKYNLDTKKLPQTTDCYILRVTVTDSGTGESRSETVRLQAK